MRNIIKGVLFKYFIATSNIEAYNWVNQWSKSYVQKLNQGISEEGYIIRERLLMRNLI